MATVPAEPGKGVARRRVLRLTLPAAGAGTSAAAVDELEDNLAVEAPLEIRVAGDTLSVTMRTPGSDRELAAGFLFAEGVISSRDDLGSLSHCGRPGTPEYGHTMDAIPAAGLSLDVDRVAATRRGTLTTSACGVCGRRSIEDVRERVPMLPPGPALEPALLFQAIEALRGRQPNFARTGGLHAAAILDATGTVLAAFEDVGRHNAVDKAVGALVLSGALGRRSAPVLGVQAPVLGVQAPSLGVEKHEGIPLILAVSGRASFELVQKAAMAGIRFLASVSAASSLAAELADSCGITLAGFVRGGSLNVYAHAERLLQAAPPPSSEDR